ncbi:MAG: DUF5682 family protein, partial [Micromonosporaceae bacterium]
MTDVHLLGIRHHGPGSARAVRRTLAELRPDLVLVEGPPEADPLVELAADTEMRPPVALLGYVADDPARCAFWPFATFSPEWQAIRYALAHDVPVRFFDLPAAHTLAPPETAPGTRPDTADSPAGANDAPEPAEIEPTPAAPASTETAPAETAPADPVRVDPLSALASAAGYDDPERWWDDMIEQRLH